jgi:hypothetical protein
MQAQEVVYAGLIAWDYAVLVIEIDINNLAAGKTAGVFT